MADETEAVPQPKRVTHVGVMQELRRAERGLFPHPEGLAHFGEAGLTDGERGQQEIGGITMTWDLWVSMGRPDSIHVRVMPSEAYFERE